MDNCLSWAQETSADEISDLMSAIIDWRDEHDLNWQAAGHLQDYLEKHEAALPPGECLYKVATVLEDFWDHGHVLMADGLVSRDYLMCVALHEQLADEAWIAERSLITFA